MPWFIFSKWKAVLEFRGVTDKKKISSLSTLLCNLGKKYRWNSQFLQMSISACELRLDRLDSRHPPFEGNVFPGCGAAYRQLVVPPLALRWQYKPNICEIAPSNMGRKIWVFCTLFPDQKIFSKTCTSSVCVVYIHRKVTNTKISTAVLERVFEYWGHFCLAIEFQTLLQEDVLFLLVDADSSVILEKLEHGLKDGLKAAVQEEEEQFGQPGGLKLDWTGLEVRLLLNPCVPPKLLERLEEFELESFIHDFIGMFIGAELSMMLLDPLTFPFPNSLGFFLSVRLLPRLCLPPAAAAIHTHPSTGAAAA